MYIINLKQFSLHYYLLFGCHDWDWKVNRRNEIKLISKSCCIFWGRKCKLWYPELLFNTILRFCHRQWIRPTCRPSFNIHEMCTRDAQYVTLYLLWVHRYNFPVEQEAGTIDRTELMRMYQQRAVYVGAVWPLSVIDHPLLDATCYDVLIYFCWSLFYYSFCVTHKTESQIYLPKWLLTETLKV